MSCAECTTRLRASAETTEREAGAMVSQTGTMAKTGGATRPSAAAGARSSVAAAYARIALGVTT